MVREIPLSKGYVALVDDEDYERLAAHKWHAEVARTGIVYATRNGPRVGGKRTPIKMHRVVAATPPGMDTDHINRNGLDNRRSNLRVATRSQNCAHRRNKAGTASGRRGVTWVRKLRKWRAVIAVNGGKTDLGVFSNKSDAARAYDAAALRAFGEFAVTNFPQKGKGST